MAEDNKEIRERNIREFFAVLNEANVFTISCPRCGDMRFSFSKNLLEIKDGLQVVCPHCSSLVHACYTQGQNEVFVQCLE